LVLLGHPSLKRDTPFFFLATARRLTTRWYWYRRRIGVARRNYTGIQICTEIQQGFARQREVFSVIEICQSKNAPILKDSWYFQSTRRLDFRLYRDDSVKSAPLIASRLDFDLQVDEIAIIIWCFLWNQVEAAGIPDPVVGCEILF
jgi:hypothetical protein